MVRLAAYAAASLNDLANLRVADLDAAGGTVRFRGDGRISGRRVRVPPELMQALRAVGVSGAVDGLIFHVPRHTLYHNLVKAGERVLGRKVSPEMIRASRILALMQQNVQVWELAAFTGVRDLNRILRYLPPWDEEEPIEPKAAGPTWLPLAPATYRMRFYKKSRTGRK